MTQKLRQFLLAAFIIHVLIAGHVFQDVLGVFASFPSDLGHPDFQGLLSDVPLQPLSAELDRLLAPGEAIRIPPAWESEDLHHQRMADGLYPRVIRSDAEAALLPNGPRTFTLIRGSVSRTFALDPVDETPPLSWGVFFAALFSVIGLGSIGVLVLGAEVGSGLLEQGAVASLAGAVVVASCYSVATWLQRPVPNSWLVALSLLGWGVWLSRRPKLSWKPKWSGGVLAVVWGAFFLRMMTHRLDGWDGRSNWLFRAKGLFYRGYVSLEDARNPFYFFSHPHYLLLYPSWMAQFTRFSEQYNERVVAMGIPVLLGAVMVLLWKLLREQVGELWGGLIVAAGVLGTRQLIWGGYVDGMLMLVIGLEYAAFATARVRLGWLVALVASLMKFEGLVFGGWVALFMFVRRRDFSVRAVLSFAVYSVALAHLYWTRQLKGDFNGIRWLEIIRDMPHRLWLIIREFGSVFQFSAVAQEAFFAIGLVVLLRFFARTKFAARSQELTWIIAGMIALIFGIYWVTPLDLAAHLGSTLDRVSLHMEFLCLFLIASLVSTTRENGGGRSRRTDTSSASASD